MAVKNSLYSLLMAVLLATTAWAQCPAGSQPVTGLNTRNSAVSPEQTVGNACESTSGLLSLNLTDLGGEVFNVRAYGAVGDGLADDTIPIKAAAAAAIAAGCGTVFFPPTLNFYRVTSTLSFTGCVHFQGGPGLGLFNSPQIRMAVPSADILDFNQGAQGSSVQGLTLRDTGTPTAGAAIQVTLTSSLDGSGQSEFLITNCAISNVYNGILLQNGNNIRIEGVNAVGASHDDLKVTGGVNIFIEKSNFFAGANADLELVNGAGIWMTDVQAFNGLHGLLIDPGTSQVVAQIFAKEVTLDSITGDAISIPSSGGSVDQLEFIDCWANSQAGGTGAYGIDILNPNLNDFSWIGGWVRESYSGGAYIGAGTNLKFSEVKFSANGLNNPAPVSGIYFAGGVSGFQVQNCLFGDLGGDSSGKQATGITIAAGSGNNFLITGNLHVTGTAILLSNASTGSPTVVANNL